jgi:hypothetical protein
LPHEPEEPVGLEIDGLIFAVEGRGAKLLMGF